MSRVFLFLALLLSTQMAPAAETPAKPAESQAAASQAATTSPSATIVRIADKLPVDAFAQLDFIEEARLSPDGQYLAGILGVSGQQNIAIVPLFDTTQVVKRVPIPDKIQVDSIRWVGSNNIIIGVRSLINVEGADWYVTRVLALNRISGALTKILWNAGGQNAGDVLWSSNSGTPEILLAAQQSIYVGHDFWPQVFRINVENNHYIRVLDGFDGVNDWWADGSGTVRMGEGNDDDRLKAKLLYRRGGNNVFHTIERVNVAQRESLIRPFMFLPDGDHALAIGQDTEGHATINEYDLSNMGLVKTLFTSPRGALHPIVDAGGTTLLGVGIGTGGGVHWFDAKLAETQAALSNAVKTADVDIASLSADHKKMLVEIHGADMPGSIYYYDTDVGVLNRLGYTNEKIGGRHLAETKMINYNARDGLEIQAKLTLPAGRAPKNLPLIVLPHGGPWAHDSMNYDYWSQFLANRGYVVIQPNFRGSTGYGEAFLRKGEGQMGFAMQDDVTDAMRWAIKEGIADAKRVCIMGASYGGYAAMWGIVKDPDQYRCAISIAGVSSMNRQQRLYDNISTANEAKLDWKRMTPDFDAISPINAVDKIKVPLLLIHGKKDVTVDVSQSRKMDAKMRAAGKSVEYIELPLADHHYQRQADRVTLLSSIETFLNKYNPAE